ncbi:MAG: preprotein translocase subunit SecG [Clostridia bacterium]|nr:preprotein translocase subunit SecG [Clostridia bacterium]
MTLLQIIGSVLLFISSVLLTVIVLAQHGRSAYLGGAIAGGAAETFLGKKKARTIDTLLSTATKVLAAVFVVLTIVVNAIVLK